MAYILYDEILQDNEDLILYHLRKLVFPPEEDKYFYIHLNDKQDLMEAALLLYDDVSEWKMLAILNNIEDPMNLKDQKIIAIRPEYLDEITNG